MDSVYQQHFHHSSIFFFIFFIKLVATVFKEASDDLCVFILLILLCLYWIHSLQVNKHKLISPGVYIHTGSSWKTCCVHYKVSLAGNFTFFHFSPLIAYSLKCSGSRSSGHEVHCCFVCFPFFLSSAMCEYGLNWSLFASKESPVAVFLFFL